MSDIAQDLDRWLEHTLAPVKPSARRAMFREIAAYLQKSQADRIKAHKNPDGTSFEPRKKRQRKGRIRQRAMFGRIRSRKHLKRRSSEDHAEVGFTGRTAKIAMVHQFGRIARVADKGPLIRYAKRELLGFTAEDINQIQHIAEKHLAQS